MEHHSDNEDFEHEYEIPHGFWEELSSEIRNLLDNLVSKFHNRKNVENLLQEKPNDSEDKKAISKWVDKIVRFFENDLEEAGTEDKIVVRSRGVVDGFDQKEMVAKLERFKVKNLATATGGTTVNNDKK